MAMVASTRAAALYRLSNKIGYRELSKSSRATRNQRNYQQTAPASGGLPKGHKPISIGVLRASKQASRPDPRTQQSKDQHRPCELPPGNKKVTPSVRGDRFIDGDAAQDRHHHRDHDRIDHAGIRRHFTLVLKFANPATSRLSTTVNEMQSSSQSWLKPSGYCVATVSV